MEQSIWYLAENRTVKKLFSVIVIISLMIANTGNVFSKSAKSIPVLEVLTECETNQVQISNSVNASETVEAIFCESQTPGQGELKITLVSPKRTKSERETGRQGMLLSRTKRGGQAAHLDAC